MTPKRVPAKRKRKPGVQVKPDERGPTIETFLATFRETANIMLSCRAAGISRHTAYMWRQTDPDFADWWGQAEQDANDRVEAEIHRRAILGIEKPITVAGEREVIREYSDTLLIFLAKGRMPHKYRDHWEGDMPPPAWAQVQATAQATVFVIDGQQKPLEAMNMEQLERAKGALLAERAGGDVEGAPVDGGEVPPDVGLMG